MLTLFANTKNTSLPFLKDLRKSPPLALNFTTTLEDICWPMIADIAESSKGGRPVK